MALNKDECGNEVKAFIESLTPEQIGSENFLEILYQGMYEVVFNHMKNNAEVYDVKVDPDSGEQIGTAKIK